MTQTAYKVILGAHNISSAGLDTNAIRVPIFKIIKHESWNPNANDYPYDIALIKLQVNEIININPQPNFILKISI